MRRLIIFALALTLFVQAVVTPPPTGTTQAVSKNPTTKQPVKPTTTKNPPSKPFVVATPQQRVTPKPPTKTSTSSCKSTAKAATNKITQKEAQNLLLSLDKVASMPIHLGPVNKSKEAVAKEFGHTILKVQGTTVYLKVNRKPQPKPQVSTQHLQTSTGGLHFQCNQPQLLDNPPTQPDLPIRSTLRDLPNF